MASSSVSSCIKRYHVFPSFHGPDVRGGFLSHLHYHFESKGILAFKDQEIERGHSIAPELVKAIRESRVSIVLLSQNYASSGWCLDELVEILKCKEDHNQIVMTVFYKVDPSSVRKHKVDTNFGRAFLKTCEGKTEEMKERWSKALTDVANIEGEHSLNWPYEAAMIQKVTADVSKKLNFTSSRDFDGIVGLDAHLEKLHSLLRVECNEVKIIGIWGPSGIGKTTIARALFNQLSIHFPLWCFMTCIDVHDYDSMLSLQSQLLSKILKQRDMKVHHLGAMKECLQDQRVLIFLDGVDDHDQLEVLAKETSWFGPGSRIIITTTNKKIFNAHGINDVYHVNFPSEEEALEILYLFAFKQKSPHDGFEELAKRVVKLCGYLPLGIRVIGSSLRGESKEEWKLQLDGLENNLDRKIEDVLRVGYDKLSEKYQSLFLHIACIFNNNYVDYVTTMLSDTNLDVHNGLKTLVARSLVDLSMHSLTMHSLLQQLGRHIVAQQSREPGKRQFLVEPEDIRDVLANETGTASVIGISLNSSKIAEFSISGKAFEGMRSLKYVTINNRVSLLEDLEYLPCLRLLHWRSYPRKCLPLKFQPEHLIVMDMSRSRLEKLWRGIQPLPNLKELNLERSIYLKEIPNLSKATNLETLRITCCESLVEIPSSISNLHKLEMLASSGCIRLEVVPTNINLASLEVVYMDGCSRLRTLPNFSRNIKTLFVRGAKIKEYPPSISRHLDRLGAFGIGNRSLSLERLTHVPISLTWLDLSKSHIKKIPDCVIGLPHLITLRIQNCTKLESIQVLPLSLEALDADSCISLKTVCFSFHNSFKMLSFSRCLKLDEESRRGILQQSCTDNYICLPGKEIPEEFTHKATGNSIAIPFPPSLRFKACLLLSHMSKGYQHFRITCQLRSKGGVEINTIYRTLELPAGSQSEDLFIFCDNLFRGENKCLEVDEIMFDFSVHYFIWEKIIEFDAEILRLGVAAMN